MIIKDWSGWSVGRVTRSAELSPPATSSHQALVISHQTTKSSKQKQRTENIWNTNKHLLQALTNSGYILRIYSKQKNKTKKNKEATEKDIYFWRGNSIHSNRMSNGQEFSDPDLNSFCKHCNPVFLQRKQILNWDFQQPDFCDQMAEAQNRAARDPGSSSRGTNPWIIWLLPLFPSIADCFYDCFFHLLIAFRRLSTCFCLLLMFYF